MPSNSPSPGKQNGALWAVLGGLGAVVIGYFYTLPQITALKEVRTTVQARAADVAALDVQAQELLATKQLLDQRSAELERLALAVPNTNGIDDLLVTLESIASTSGVVLASVQPVVTAGTKGSEAAVTLRGSYSGVRLFLEQLAKNLRPIKITELSIAGSSDVAGASLVDVSLTVIAADSVVRTSGEASPSGDQDTRQLAPVGGSNE